MCRSPVGAPALANNNHHDDDDGDDEDGCCRCCCCCCDGGGGGGGDDGGDSDNGPPRLKNTRVLAHSRPDDDTVSRCCGTKIGAAGPHGVFRAARLTSRNPPHTTIDPNGGRTDVRTDGRLAGRQGGITGEAAGGARDRGSAGGGGTLERAAAVAG